MRTEIMQATRGSRALPPNVVDVDRIRGKWLVIVQTIRGTLIEFYFSGRLSRDEAIERAESMF